MSKKMPRRAVIPYSVSEQASLTVDMKLDAPPREDHAEPLPAARLNPPGITEIGPYRLRFAVTRGDLYAVQRLRYTVFNEELGEGLAESHVTGRDEDAFDAVCQHILVEEIAGGGVVGTYRLQLAELAAERSADRRTGAGLYSAEEFDFAGVPREALERGVELGRACVHGKHRHRRALYLLWHGLIHFCLHHGKRAFFGCSSLTSEDPAEGLRFQQFLQDGGFMHPEYLVVPRPSFRCDADPAAIVRAAAMPVPKVPKLFGTYLRVGAKILGPPALDREFRTIDFLTWVDLDRSHTDAYGHPNARL